MRNAQSCFLRAWMVWILRLCCPAMSRDLCQNIDKIKNHELGFAVVLVGFVTGTRGRGVVKSVVLKPRVTWAL